MLFAVHGAGPAGVGRAPNPEEFPKLLDQMGAYMRKSYDWSADVKKLTMPVMLIYAVPECRRGGRRVGMSK